MVKSLNICWYGTKVRHAAPDTSSFASAQHTLLCTFDVVACNTLHYGYNDIYWAGTRSEGAVSHIEGIWRLAMRNVMTMEDFLLTPA